MPQKKFTVEVKSFAEESKYFLLISGHIDILCDLVKVIPLRNDLDKILQNARSGYMPKQSYDDLGSNVRMFANDYARIMHVTKRSPSEEIQVVSREQISDILINSDWQLIGFASCASNIPTGMAVIERWQKTVGV